MLPRARCCSRVAVALVGLASASASGCSAPSETSIRLSVSYQSSWGLTSLELDIADRTTAADATDALVVLVPDEWGGQSVHIELDGLRGDVHWAHGAVDVTVERGREVSAMIALALLPCAAACTEGAAMCAGDGIAVCEQRDADACLEWSDPIACPAAAPFCSFGLCAAECTDECADDDTQCAGPGAVKACGQAPDDSDRCRDWLPAELCPDGEVCSAGRCAAECTDACAAGDVTCADGGVATCGDLDGDGCLEWGFPVLCSDGESCSDGECSRGCTDDCSVAACQDQTYRDCGQYDLDPCLDWSTGVSCIPADACTDGTCTPDGCNSTPVTCDDAPAPMCTDAILRSYTAAGTCSAGDCDYPFTEILCPAGCVGGACVCESTCALVSVATAQGRPSGIALDDTYVYWTAYDDDAVRRRSRALGTIETVATGQNGAIHVAVDASHVYWTADLGNTVMRRAISLGAAAIETVATGQTGAGGIALDGTNVYWTTTTGVFRRAKTLGVAAIETVATGQDITMSVALDATHVYWTTYGGDTVMRRAKTLASAAETVASNQQGAEGLTTDATHIYWTAAEADAVRRRAKTLGGASVESVATNQDGAWGVAVADGYVYWAAITANTISRRAVTLGASAVEPLADDQDGATDLAIDASHLYWTATNGAVTRLSRCACEL